MEMYCRFMSLFLLFITASRGVKCFSPSKQNLQQKRYLSTNLFKLDQCSEIPSLSKCQAEWDFFLLEDADVAAASELALECFWKPRLKLNTNGMSNFEANFWNFIVATYTKFDRDDTRRSNYLGFKTRSNKRLIQPNLDISADSILLAVTPKAYLRNNDNEVGVAIAGIIEICLEKPDGNLAPPFKFPWLPRPVRETDEPYLCNLCIAETYRRLGLATLMCNVCEEIVTSYWKKQFMYLHVEQSNSAAQQLYSKLGYRLTKGLSEWEAKMQGLESIVYYRKYLLSDGKVIEEDVESIEDQLVNAAA